MPEPTKRKSFLTVGRLIMMFVIGGLGALMHWLLLPEPTVSTPTINAGLRDPAGSSENLAAAPGGPRKALTPTRATLGDILSKPYWLRTDLILSYLDGADAAATAELLQALSPEITSINRANGGGMPQQWRVQLLFILSHWAEVDPQAMMVQVQQLKLDLETVYLAYSMWVQLDWRAARAHMPSFEGVDWMGFTLEQEALEDPVGVLARLKAETNTRPASASVVAAALGELFQKDPKQALQTLLQKLPSYKAMHNYWPLHQKLTEFMAASPQQTLAQLREMATSDPKAVQLAMRLSGRDLMDRFPEYAYDWIQWSEPAVRQRLQEEPRVLKRQEDPVAALATARAINNDDLADRALKQLSSSDPARWLQEMKQAPDSPVRQEQIKNGIQLVASRQPQAALALAQSLPENSQRGAAMHEVGRGWASTNPEASVAEVLAFYPGATSDQGFLSGLIEQRLWTDKVGSLAMAEAATGKVREAALFQVLGKAGQESPQFLWDHFDLLPQGQQRESVVANALRMPIDTATGERSAEAVLGRWEGLPEMDHTPRTSVAVAETLYNIDPTRASLWVRDLPAGAARDTASLGLVQRIAHDTRDGAADYEAAWQWAGAIQDTPTRLKALRITASPWLDTNPTEFAATVESSPLSEADKTVLRNSFLLPHP